MAASRKIGGPARLVWLVVVALLTVVGVVTLPSAAGAQDDARGEQPEITVRIAAQRIADGRTEFARQLRQADDSWGARLLPTRRFFPAAARVGRWLVSTPLSLSVETAAGEAPATGVEVRIVARRGSDNRIEFALQRHEADESWSEPLLPTRRFFPAAARVGRWLFSTPLSVWESQPPPSTTAVTRFTAIAAGSDYSCGLRSDGGIECWGWTGERTGDPPGGVFTAVAAGNGHGCGIRANRTVACWGNNDHGQATARSGQFIALSAAHDQTCGLRTSGTVRCWGRDGEIEPGGQFRQIDAGPTPSCGLRQDRTIGC